MYTEKDRLEQFASKIELDGRIHTDNGSWIVYFDEFNSEERELLLRHKDEVITILNERESVAEALLVFDDTQINTSYLDIIYYLNYCPNVPEEEYTDLMED